MLSGARPTKIVILGGGFVGVGAALEFERCGRTDLAVTLVNPENFQLFTPMLPEVAGGSLEMRSVVQPLRVALRHTAFVLGTATGVDVDSRTVTIRHAVLETESILQFDHLIFALGSETSALGVSGVARYAYPLKTLPDAARLRAQIGSAFEAAAAATNRVEIDRLLRVVVIGGGFTGVEATGELSAFMKRMRRFYPEFKGSIPEISLIESGSRLLSELPPEFGSRAARSLRERDVCIVLNAEVERVDSRGVLLKNGTRYESGTVVWTAGVEPAPFVKTVGLQTSAKGALIVGGDLSVPGRPGIWAAGDCAHVPKKGGGTYPPLAQIAVRAGPFLARNVLASLAGKKTKPLKYRPAGMMASLGDGDAIAQLPGGAMLAGRPAWLVWRAFYLIQLPGLLRKLRVASDWTTSGLFAQNVARLPWTSEALTRLEDSEADG
jgi:NADH dehydrogenase